MIVMAEKHIRLRLEADSFPLGQTVYADGVQIGTVTDVFRTADGWKEREGDREFAAVEVTCDLDTLNEFVKTHDDPMFSLKEDARVAQADTA